VLIIVKKPKKGQEPSNIKVDSIYLFNTDFVNLLEKAKKTEYSLEETITNFVKHNHGAWIENNSEVSSLKYPWHLFNLFSQFISRENTHFSENAIVSDTAIFDDTNGPVIVDDGARIGDFVKLVGPCYIGRNCLVGDYSFVRGSSLEEGSIVGAKTEVVRCIMFEKSSLHFGYMADSIIGHGTKIGAGLITANKRLDRNNVRVKVKEQLIDSGSNTLGIIVGEKANIGIRTSTMPGITIATNAKVLPNSTVNRNIK